jgi:hypothetical protein
MTASMLNSVTLISRMTYNSKKTQAKVSENTKWKLYKLCRKMCVHFDRKGVGLLGAHG